MIGGFSKAIGQMSDSRFQRVLYRGLGLAFVALIVLWILVWWMIGDVSPEDFDGVVSWLPGWMVGGATWFLSGALYFAGFAALLFASYLLFPPLMTAMMGIWLETVAEAVEDKHYPGLPPGRDQPIMEGILSGLTFLGVSVGINILALPLYFVPAVNAVAFWLINGYLLSREFFEIVAARRLAPDAAKALRRKVTGRIFPFGVVTAFMFTLPFVNLVTPILATAAMVHIFNRHADREGVLRGRPGGGTEGVGS